METDLHPLRQWRQKKRMRQADLAKHVGTDQGTISQIERRNYFPSAGLIARLSKATGLKPQAFLPEADLDRAS